MEIFFGAVVLFALLASLAFLVRGPWRLWHRVALVALQPLLVLAYVAAPYEVETCRAVLRLVGAPAPHGWITFPCLDMVVGAFGVHALVWGVVAAGLVVRGWRGRQSTGPSRQADGTGPTRMP